MTASRTRHIDRTDDERVEAKTYSYDATGNVVAQAGPEPGAIAHATSTLRVGTGVRHRVKTAVQCYWVSPLSRCAVCCVKMTFA